MSPEHGWIAYTPGDNAHLSRDVRTEVEQRIQQHRRERGALLAIVEVRVYEHGAEPQLSFPPEARLGPDSEPDVLAGVVARARDRLAAWR